MLARMAGRLLDDRARERRRRRDRLGVGRAVGLGDDDRLAAHLDDERLRDRQHRRGGGDGEVALGEPGEVEARAGERRAPDARRAGSRRPPQPARARRRRTRAPCAARAARAARCRSRRDRRRAPAARASGTARMTSSLRSMSVGHVEDRDVRAASPAARSRLASETAEMPTIAWPAPASAAPSTGPTRPAPTMPRPRRPERCVSGRSSSARGCVAGAGRCRVSGVGAGGRYGRERRTGRAPAVAAVRRRGRDRPRRDARRTARRSGRRVDRREPRTHRAGDRVEARLGEAEERGRAVPAASSRLCSRASGTIARLRQTTPRRSRMTPSSMR